MMQLGYNLHKLQNALSFQVTSQSSLVDEFLRAYCDHQGYIASNGWTITASEAGSPYIDINSRTIALRGRKLDGNRPDVTWGISTNRRNIAYRSIDAALQQFIGDVIMNANEEYELVEQLYVPVDILYVPVAGLMPPVKGGLKPGKGSSSPSNSHREKISL
jgi:hypothetical protein